jgi:hypothetical protein
VSVIGEVEKDILHARHHVLRERLVAKHDRIEAGA